MRTERLNRPMSMRDLIAKEGGAMLGNPEAKCPHCGKEARAYEVTTPRLGWMLIFWIPPVKCCPASMVGRQA